MANGRINQPAISPQQLQQAGFGQFTPPPETPAGGQPDTGLPATGPAATPEEHEQRKAGWKSFILGVGDRFQNDPQFRAFMFNLGTRLMQPIAPGQTEFGHLGASLQGAQDYTRALGAARAGAAARATELAGEAEERALKREEFEAGAERRETQADLDRARAEEARARATKAIADAAEAGGTTTDAFAKDMNRTTFISKGMEFWFPDPDSELPESEQRAIAQEDLGLQWDQLNRGRPGAAPGAPEPDVVRQARDAIAAGKDPAAVRAKLRELKHDPEDWGI